MTRRDRDNKSGASVQENYRKRLKWYGHVRRMKEEHIGRIMLDVDKPGIRRRRLPNLIWKDSCKTDMTSGVERRQCNKQNRMDEEANQLCWRPLTSGQAREE